MTSQSQKVAELLEYALTSPEAILGRRLKSERDLAMLLDIGRRQANEALSLLAHRGLLSRTRGSGTYVTQRPQLSPSEAQRLRLTWEQGTRYRPEDVFAEAEESTEVTARRSNAPLHLCLCGDWLDASPVHHAIVDRMLATVQQRGHTLSIISVIDEAGRALPPEVLGKQLRNAPADGYLVVDRWAEQFRFAAQGMRRPVIYCGNSSDLHYEPAVGICHIDATVRVLRRFCESGFSRIAMLGYYNTANPSEVQEDAYVRSVTALGLNYRRCELIRVGELRAAAIVRQLLDSPDRPDALYLSDEFLAPALIAAADTLGLRLGRDMGLICFSNRGVSNLPHEWSRYEIDIRLAGQLAVEALIRTIETGEEYASNIVLQPRWQPRETHGWPLSEKSHTPSTHLHGANHPSSPLDAMH